MFKMIKVMSFLATFLPVLVFGAEPYEEGKQYIRLDNTVPTQSSGKLRWLKPFGMGAPTAFQLEPYLEGWKKKLPEEHISFRKVPAMFNDEWKTHGQFYFALDALNVPSTIHNDVFTSIHKQGRRLNTRDDMVKFVETYGVSEKEFDKAYKSFGVRNKMRQADAMIRGARLTGVPALIINGKYKVSAREAGGRTEMLKVAEYLIEKRKATGIQSVVSEKHVADTVFLSLKYCIAGYYR